MLATNGEERILGGVESADIHTRPNEAHVHFGSGIYATDQRLIIVPSDRGLGVIVPIAAIATGLPTSYSTKTLAWLDSQSKEFEARKESISAIVMTRKKGAIGGKRLWLEITLTSGQSYPILVMGGKTSDYLVQLMVEFCPDRVVVDGVRAAASPTAPQVVPGRSTPSSQYSVATPPTYPPSSQSAPRASAVSPQSSLYTPPPAVFPAAATSRPMPPPPAPPPVPFCTSCGMPTTYIAQYGRYYCYPCARYV